MIFLLRIRFNNFKRVFFCVVMISAPTVAHSLISGKLDTLLETDQAAYYSRNRIEEQVDLHWRNHENNMNAGVQFDFKGEEFETTLPTDDRAELQFNQLFFTQNAAGFNYTIGRFNRSDLLGFYTLDGIVANTSRKNWGVSVHAGKPLQIEDYNVIDADKIFGIDINHQNYQIKNSVIKNISSHIGWQQIAQGLKQNYIHWGFTATDEIKPKQTEQIKLFFNGSYLVENKIAESINAGLQLYSKESGLTRLAYTSWNPKQAVLTFKERFYSVYANGRQTDLQADYFYDHRWNQQYYIRARKVWREFGNNGYGATAGFEQKARSKNNPGVQIQLDTLVLQQDIIHSLFLGMNKDLSSTLRGHLNTALQYKKVDAVQNNRLVALEAVAEQMLKSNLFVDLNARYIYNENIKNEYRIGFRLSYRFDGYGWGGR